MPSSEQTVTRAELESLYLMARSLGHEAGELIRTGRDAAIRDVSTKSDPTDAVTAMDTACERLLRERIAAARPHDGIEGEEHDEQAGSSGVRWIIDPIDGTVNYLYGIASYAVSIGVEVHGELAVGVVTAPALGQQYHAMLGEAAYLNDEPIICTQESALPMSLVSTGFGYRPQRRRQQGQVVAQLLPQVRDVRRFGSASLDLCRVASGMVDAYYEWGTHVWDWAAGAVICRAAGAAVALPEHDEGLVVAAAPGVIGALQDALAQAIDPEWAIPA